MKNTLYLTRTEANNKTLVAAIIKSGHDIVIARPSNKIDAYSKTLKGWRTFPDGRKYYFKSLWEINFAYYSEYMKTIGEIKDWEYEPDTFLFEKVVTGIRTYKPDFRWTEFNGVYTYYEIKGYVDASTKTKLNRMRKYFPNVKLHLIDSDQYYALKKFGRLINFE